MAIVPTRTRHNLTSRVLLDFACLVKSHYQLCFFSGIQLFFISLFFIVQILTDRFIIYLYVPFITCGYLLLCHTEILRDSWIHDIGAAPRKAIKNLIPTPFCGPVVSVTTVIYEALQLRISIRSQQTVRLHP